MFILYGRTFQLNAYHVLLVVLPTYVSSTWRHTSGVSYITEHAYINVVHELHYNYMVTTKSISYTLDTLQTGRWNCLVIFVVLFVSINLLSCLLYIFLEFVMYFVLWVNILVLLLFCIFMRMWAAVFSYKKRVFIILIYKGVLINKHMQIVLYCGMDTKHMTDLK